jgi:hypothetical protein
MWRLPCTPLDDGMCALQLAAVSELLLVYVLRQSDAVSCHMKALLLVRVHCQA